MIREMAAEWNPLIISAVMTPDPAMVGGTVLLQAVVIDAQTVEQTETRMSGELMSGEV